MAAYPIFPIFLPHAGCPFQCVYCDQNSVVSQRAHGLSGTDAVECFKAAFARLRQDAMTSRRPGQLAFYGGTFTAIPMEKLRTILSEVVPFIQQGVFTGIRFSTRPDCLGPAVCSLLADYPVDTVELGAQSMDDEVLRMSRRGYSREHVREAAERVRDHGWRLGIQLMPGLPGDCRDTFRGTIAYTIAMKPDFVRLYPTLVIENTVLARWFYEKSYQPLSLEEALAWCSESYDQLLQAGIHVARMGLHADPALQAAGAIVAGPYHPAFGYLVKVHWWRRQVDLRLTRASATAGKTLTVKVPQHQVSEVVGPGRANISHWSRKWLLGGARILGQSAWDSHSFEVECV